LDLAISGDGFFALQRNDGSNIYSRNGGFMLDKQNVIVNGLGHNLVGQAYNTTTGTASGPLGPITIAPSVDSTSPETAKVTFSALTAGQTVILGGITVTAGGSGATAVEVAAAFKSIATGSGGDATGANIASAAGTLTGWTSGPASGNAVTFSSVTNGNVADLANTGTGTTSIASSPATYNLTGMNISGGGLITANYGDGTTVKTAQISIAKFATNSGLNQVGDASYLATSDSGVPSFGEGGDSGYGSILSGSIERSNVDITTELVDLIKAQRNFQANAKAIETTSSMATTLINIRN